MPADEVFKIMLIIRLNYWAYRWVSGMRHWGARRLTRAGLLALIGMFVVGAIGVDLNQSLGSHTFAMVVCLMMVAVISSTFFRGSFDVRRRLPLYASVGQPLRYPIVVRNRGSRAYRDLELLEEWDDPRPRFEEFAARWRARTTRGMLRTSSGWSQLTDFQRVIADWTPVPELPPGGEAVVAAEVWPLRRGTLRFRSAVVARCDPLGLVRGWSRSKQSHDVTVLPRRYRLPNLALLGAKQYQPGGVTLASSIGESDEFISLREYRPGDPLRHIHWRTWARIGRPIVKEYQDEYFIRYALILDTFGRSEQAEAFEEAVSVAASLASTVATQESLLDLLFVGPQAYCFTAGRGVGQVEHVLRVLAGVQLCRDKGVEALRAQVLRHAELVSSCVMVLLQWDADRRQLVRELRAMGLPVLVLVVSESEAASGLPSARTMESGARVRLLRVGTVEEDLQALEEGGS